MDDWPKTLYRRVFYGFQFIPVKQHAWYIELMRKSGIDYIGLD
jgi:hypothetical protein